MTAIDWFLEELENNDWYWLPESIKNEIINQAKEIEKQQMWNYIKTNYVNGENSLAFHEEEFEQYYNENYKSNEQK